MNQTKICTECKIEKQLTEFSKDKSKKDGLQYKCKTCVKQYQQTNKKSIAANNKEWREANKESLAISRKAYCQTNKKLKSEYDKQYNHANKEAILARNKRYKQAIFTNTNW